MHIISRKALREFWEIHADAETSLMRWYRIVNSADYQTFVELRETFPSADMVGDLVVFNIGGNKARLIAAIHYNRRKVYIRAIVQNQAHSRRQRFKCFVSESKVCLIQMSRDNVNLKEPLRIKVGKAFQFFPEPIQPFRPGTTTYQAVN